jgi:hypothetical protein
MSSQYIDSIREDFLQLEKEDNPTSFVQVNSTFKKNEKHPSECGTCYSLPEIPNNQSHRVLHSLSMDQAFNIYIRKTEKIPKQFRPLFEKYFKNLFQTMPSFSTDANSLGFGALFA